MTIEEAQEKLDHSSNWGCPQCEMNDARVMEKSSVLKEGVLPSRFKLECGCCGNHFHIILK